MADRKYRQSGYQDESTTPRRDRDPGPAKERQPGPRGRGSGTPQREVFRCRDCGEPAAAAAVALDSRCVRCGRSLHACVNCRYFDPAARWECRTEIAQRVLGKATANRCPAYAAKVALEQGEESKADDPRAAFDALFR